MKILSNFKIEYLSKYHSNCLDDLVSSEYAQNMGMLTGYCYFIFLLIHTVLDKGACPTSFK